MNDEHVLKGACEGTINPDLVNTENFLLLQQWRAHTFTSITYTI